MEGVEAAMMQWKMWSGYSDVEKREMKWMSEVRRIRWRMEGNNVEAVEATVVKWKRW